MDGVAGAARGAADSVIDGGDEAASGGAAVARSDGGPAVATPPAGAADTSESIVRERRAVSSPPPAVRAADVAALQRWLARVWPAVALGDGGVNGTSVVEVMAEEVLRPALAAVTGLLLASSPVLPISDSRFTADPAAPNALLSRPAPDPAPLSSVDDGGKVVYLIAIVGLLALLVFTVWREFRLALHPRLR